MPDANVLILDDQATIGGVWSAAKIYQSLFAQIKIGQFEYSFYPMKRENITDDGYIGASTIHSYLNDFARDFDLVRRTRLRTRVAKVERREDGMWQLEVEVDEESSSGSGPQHGSATTTTTRLIETPRLIYATGATSHPVLPKWPRSPDFAVPVVHSSDIGLHQAALRRTKRATVVGAAKSAYDVVFLLLSEGVQVDWLIREDGTGPLAIMPPRIGLLNTLDVAATGVVAAFSANIMKAHTTSHRLLHGWWLGRLLVSVFWRWLTWVAALHAGYGRSANGRKLTPEPVGSGIHWANAGLGTASVPDFWKVFHAGNCTVHRTAIATLGAHGAPRCITLRNGTVLEDNDYLILCTGFDKSYHQFDAKLQVACGLIPPSGADITEVKRWNALEADAERTVDALLPGLTTPPSGLRAVADPVPERGDGESQSPVLHGPSLHYRRLVVPAMAAAGDRSVFFPGFIHTIYTPLVSEVQALWGVAFMLGLVELPARPDMEREVAEWNVWTRKRYLAQGRKHAYAIYDFFAVSVAPPFPVHRTWRVFPWPMGG